MKLWHLQISTLSFQILLFHTLALLSIKKIQLIFNRMNEKVVQSFSDFT